MTTYTSHVIHDTITFRLSHDLTLECHITDTHENKFYVT